MVAHDNENIVVSPIARTAKEIPVMAATEYIFENLRANMPRLRGKNWMVNVQSGDCIKFEAVESSVKKVASALARRGFNKGDVLYFVNYNMTQVFIVQLAVWSLGGITRGWYQSEPQELYTKQIEECKAKFVLIDEDTAPVMLKAVHSCHITIFAFGNVPGATSVSELFEDDGSAYPSQVDISPKDDVMAILSTSGSTGNPKGVLHTHFMTVASVHGRRPYCNNGVSSILSSMVNYSGGLFSLLVDSLCSGGTVFNIPKPSKETYMDVLLKFKPDMVIMYQYLASWLVRNPRIYTEDLTFLKTFLIGGAMLDPGTSHLLTEALPHVNIQQYYGMTECCFISGTALSRNSRITPVQVPGEERQVMSTGNLFPYVKVKIIDVDNGRSLSNGESGEILVHTPCVMKGYLSPGKKPESPNVDSDGWFHTGDLGFTDVDGNVYVIERINFVFKYLTMPVMPSEIEAILKQHQAVHDAGVVGIPNPETDNLTRAYIVLRQGYVATCTELKEHVAMILPKHKHLHGGACFVDTLPLNRNGKLDRKALTKFAINHHLSKVN